MAKRTKKSANKPRKEVSGAARSDSSGQAAPRIDIADHKLRADRAWAERLLWQKLYDDAYEFVIPYRQPSSKIGKGVTKVERIFDATAIESSFRAAGQLHQDLFPPDFWKLAVGPVAKVMLEEAAADELSKQLEQITNIASAFFQTGEFDMASSETCIDLLVGTGVLFPVEGDDVEPIRWVCIPFDEIAIEVDAYGRPVAIFWKSRLTRRAIMSAFKNGKYPPEFLEALRDKPNQEIDINQDFIYDPDQRRWIFCAWLGESEIPIIEDEYRTQPMAVARYHRVPGEPYGRGPILLSLPTVKTLNKAAELTLKAAAIQLLGIWGYRPGGAFNPNTARLGPGEFWAMSSTGGMLGADVQRLDVSAGKVDVGNLVTREMRLQVQSMLGDDRLPAEGGTPVSAAEIMARMKRISQNYLGAYGRLVNEIVPVIVRRVLEILYRRKLISQSINIDTLLIKVDVLSPIAAAVKATAHQRSIEFLQLVASVRGPQAIDMIVKVDDLLRKIANDVLPPSLVMTAQETAALQAKLAAAAAQLAASQQPQPSAPA